MKVLCALDGSKHSRWVGDVLKRVPFPEGSSLLLVHVLDRARLRLPKDAGGTAQGAMKIGITVPGTLFF